jgi:hypothetical protein
MELLCRDDSRGEDTWANEINEEKKMMMGWGSERWDSDTIISHGSWEWSTSSRVAWNTVFEKSIGEGKSFWCSIDNDSLCNSLNRNHEKSRQVHSPQESIFHLRDTKEDAKEFFLFFQLCQDQWSRSLMTTVGFKGMKHRGWRFYEQPAQVYGCVVLR